MSFRKARKDDLDRIMEIYGRACEFMRKNGNPNQWPDSYPSRRLLLDDMAKGSLYLVEASPKTANDEFTSKAAPAIEKSNHEFTCKPESPLKKSNDEFTCKAATILAVFAFIIGSDPTYTDISQPGWLSEKEYGTIHRLASSGETGGIFERVLAFCATKTGHIRVDTHRDNLIMQKLFIKQGFSFRGLIKMPDGSERLAYELEKL